MIPKHLISSISKPASITEISDFENENSIMIPIEYKELLLFSNGVMISGQINHPIYNDWTLKVYEYLYSIDELQNTFILFENFKQDGIRFQYQENILNIGSTYDGPKIMLGCANDIYGKIYLADIEEITRDKIIPLYKLADSLTEFIEMIKV